MLYVLLDALRGRLEDAGVYWLVSLLDQIQFRAFAAVGLSFVLGLALGRRTIAFLRRLKIGDSGFSDADALRAHFASKANVPTMGGVLIAGSIAFTTLLLADISRFHVQLALVVLVWLAALGGVDDWLKLTASRRGLKSRQGLRSWEKLVFQVGLGLLVGGFLYSHGNTDAPQDLAHVLNLPLQKTFQSGTGIPSPGLIYLSAPAFVLLTVLMMAGMSNAVNITDGMDGLASGICAAVSLGLVVLALLAGWQQAAHLILVPYIPFADELAVVAGAMAGACLGFLWWNCAPAQVFMGDTGSLCLGGLIGYIATVVRQEAVVLLMSAVFLAEIGSVVLQVGYFKLSGGKRIFRCAPLHHHLHLLGWTEQQVVARLWIVGVILVVAALQSLKVR